MPSKSPPNGWRWTALTKLARMESGHTPSRKRPDYWGGTIPWIGIQDAKSNHGRRIHDTHQKTNELGIAHSSARILPENTVCLSRTASVGYVVVMGRPMATSQDFVNWVCSSDLDHDFLKYLFIAEDDNLLRFSSGAVHQTIYFPEAKAFHICHPPLPEQRRIVGILDEVFDGIAVAKANAEKNLQNARALFESHLNAVFTERGEGWLNAPLENVVAADCSLSYGIVQPGEEFPDGMPVARPVDLTTKIIRLSGLKRVDPRVAKAYRRTTLKGGEVLLCVRGSTGEAALASDELKGANVTRGIVPIRFETSRVVSEFGYYAITSNYVQKQIESQTRGAALMQINIRDLRKITLPVPDLATQQNIVDSSQRLEAETQHLQSIYQRKLAALDELKKSLLDQAFRGEL
jgi:type I restriction enzyme S subunit